MTYFDKLVIAFAFLMVYPLWTLLHEASHVFVASLMAPVKRVSWKLYPHRDVSGNLYFAKVDWAWSKLPESSKRWRAMLYLAPRVMNVVASIAFPFSFIFSSPWSYAWLIFWGGGLVDFFIGSIGRSNVSDLQRASNLLSLSPWVIRILGLSVVLSSLICFVLRSF